MSSSATIKLYLPTGDANGIRTAEISNWSGKAIASPRTALDSFLNREEVHHPGIYILFGVDVHSGKPAAYIGEAENVAERVKSHKGKDFWNATIAFVSKDANLTKAHVRYLEGQFIEKATSVGRYVVRNSLPSGAKLPESDVSDMEVFLTRAAQLLPVLGSDLLTPIAGSSKSDDPAQHYTCKRKGAVATGVRTPSGFVVFAGSTALKEAAEHTKINGPWIIALREQLKQDGRLVLDEPFLRFTKDVEFSSPSAAAATIYGGNAAGPLVWKNSHGKTLKEVEAS